MNAISKRKLLDKLRASKEYREAYVEEHIKTGLPFQLRAMRNARSWSQSRLGQEAGMRQNAISRIEDEDYGSLSINTLFRLAAAFDVGLIVKFVSFSRLIKEYEDLSPENLNAISFEGDDQITINSITEDSEIIDNHNQSGVQASALIIPENSNNDLEVRTIGSIPAKELTPISRANQESDPASYIIADYKNIDELDSVPYDHDYSNSLLAAEFSRGLRRSYAYQR